MCDNIALCMCACLHADVLGRGKGRDVLNRYSTCQEQLLLILGEFMQS